MDYGVYLLGLTISEIRAIKRAVRVLVRAGFHVEEATQLILAQHHSRPSYQATRRAS